jgi:hypothetical protein
MMWNVDASAVQGAVFALLESSYGVDILDEWALLPRLAEFPMIVIPEQTNMSNEMVTALKNYALNGGGLLVTGSGMYDRFGTDFLGFAGDEVQTGKSYDIPADDGSVSLFSKEWRLGKATTGTVLGNIGNGSLLEDKILQNPAAVINQIGKGKVIYVPAAIFHDFAHNRYQLTRCFIREITEKLLPDPMIRVKAPTCIDVTMRQRDGEIIIHFVNRISGIPNTPNNGAIDEIPPVGPITVHINMNKPPKAVAGVLEDNKVDWQWNAGQLSIQVSSVYIHNAVVVKI